jgi:5-formaminoimidazole-4-carboxamide-1-beta-D-ribofuranosyl 5'-monophosphate synthetase
MIQGNKYQHMIYGQDKMEILNEMKIKYPFVFDDNYYPTNIRVGKLSGNGNGKGYNSYTDRKAERYTVYKYFTLDEKITHEDLINVIVEDLNNNCPK